MRNWLHRIRGAVGMGLAWAATWAGVGVIVGVITGVLTGRLVEMVVGFGVSFAVLGLSGGTIFSIVLSIAEGRRRFDQMSLTRFAFWGAAGALLLTVFSQVEVGGGTGLDVMMDGVIVLLGAGSAAGSLALARRADDRELLDHGADVAEIGLTEEETQQLLGRTG